MARTGTPQYSGVHGLLVQAPSFQATMTTLLLLITFLSVESFVIHQRNGRRYRTSLQADEGKESLTFQANVTCSSDPISGTTIGELCTFFRSEECRRLFLSAGGEKAVEEIERSPELLEMWKSLATESYGSDSLPRDGDPILVTTSEIHFPGLTLETFVCSGVKLLESVNGLPEYRFLLVAEKQNPRGPAPLVWIFNQLTGAAKKPKDKFILPSTRAKTNAAVVENNDGSYAIKFECEVIVKIVFPKMLARVMPSSKEKMEQQGSESIMKTVLKDVSKAVGSVQTAFVADFAVGNAQ